MGSLKVLSLFKGDWTMTKIVGFNQAIADTQANAKKVAQREATAVRNSRHIHFGTVPKNISLASGLADVKCRS